MCVAPRQEPCPGNTAAKLQNVWESARKFRKNLEGTGKMLIFAASNLKFGYPGKFPAGEQDHIDTTPIK
jgi:hypothetical protein